LTPTPLAEVDPDLVGRPPRLGIGLGPDHGADPDIDLEKVVEADRLVRIAHAGPPALPIAKLSPVPAAGQKERAANFGGPPE